MKLEIDKIGEPGCLYVESTDIRQVNPVRDGDHAAEIVVKSRRQYQDTTAFHWDGQDMRLQLLPRQVRQVIDQLREANTAFCSGDRGRGCYDYGKTDRPAGNCTRCLLLSACLKSRQGDLRRGKPVTTDHHAGLIVAMWVCLVAFVVCLNLWARTSTELQETRAALETCQRPAKQSPTRKTVGRN